MKILLSPSEGKLAPEEIKRRTTDRDIALLDDVMWGGMQARTANVRAYLATLGSASEGELCKLFGTKRLDVEMLGYCSGVLEGARICAIELYSGVAYRALDFGALDSYAQAFLLDSVLIMSNLFGLVRAGDKLPYYHLNQNYRSASLSLRKLYQAQQEEIDGLLSGEEDGVIIDLRAQIYCKAYPLRLPHYVLELPSGTSHRAKHYRGAALRGLAEHYASLPVVRGGHSKDCARESKQLARAMLPYIQATFTRCDGLFG